MQLTTDQSDHVHGDLKTNSHAKKHIGFCPVKNVPAGLAMTNYEKHVISVAYTLLLSCMLQGLYRSCVIIRLTGIILFVL